MLCLQSRLTSVSSPTCVMSLKMACYLRVVGSIAHNLIRVPSRGNPTRDQYTIGILIESHKYFSSIGTATSRLRQKIRLTCPLDTNIISRVPYQYSQCSLKISTTYTRGLPLRYLPYPYEQIYGLRVLYFPLLDGSVPPPNWCDSSRLGLLGFHPQLASKLVD